jgi:hypothetical protein
LVKAVLVIQGMPVIPEVLEIPETQAPTVLEELLA